MSIKIRSICLVRLSALGDVLMFVPLVRALQRHYPDAELTWVISPLAYTLVEGMDGVEFIVLDKPKNLRDYWRFRRSLRHRRFDVLLAAQASLRANLLYPCIRATRKIGYDKARGNDGHAWFVNEQIEPGREHTLDGFLKFGAALGVAKKAPVWNMPVGPEHKAWACAELPDASKPVLVVNPAASKPERSWSAEGYIQVIRFVLSRWPVQVVLTGGPGASDKALGDAIAAELPEVLNLIGKTQPKQLLALIDHAALVLCPDTGPSHMATAMGTPVVALHAVTNLDISGPYASKHLAINAYPRALERLKLTVDSAPWGKQVHEPWAMQLVSIDAVIARLNQVLPQVLDQD
ncbi:MAG: glycosyltransferase family 9 protein [Legionellaceae bacterium]|jgi:heptosyltransferase I|nr:glycosyltransferase family 9 protein [Legionellaceae bacterium]